jgi:hypothetical protein
MIVKPAGLVPRYSDPLRREIRGDLRNHSQGVLDDTIKNEKAKLAGAALTELGTIGNVRGMTPREYEAAKRHALTLTRRALDPKP